MSMVCRDRLCIFVLGALLAAPHVSAAATCTWTGLGTNNNWSTAANWDNCGGAHPTPQTGDSLVFPSGSSRAAPVNDLMNLSVDAVRITGVPASGSSYVISGNSIGLIGSELQFNTPADLTGNGPVFDVSLSLNVATVISNIGTAAARLNAIELNASSLILASNTANLTVEGRISGTGPITKNGPHTLSLRGANTFTGPMQIDAGTVRLRFSRTTGLGSPAAGTTVSTGARLVLEPFVSIDDALTLDGGELVADGLGGEFAAQTWNGNVTLTADSVINTDSRSRLTINGAISGASTLTKVDNGELTLNGTSPSFIGQTLIQSGSVRVNGNLANSAIRIIAGGLGGRGTVGAVSATSAVFRLFASEVLNTDDVTLSTGTTFEFQLRGVTPGSGQGQLHVTGTVNLANAALARTLEFLPPQHTVFTLIDNDGTDPVVGTFKDLPEGAVLTLGGFSGLPFVISYIGGTGNDVTLTLHRPTRYILSEGATGSFFDEDLVIANPNTVATPVSIAFLTPGGSPIVQERTLAPQSRTTIRVDQIAGLEATQVSTVVTSTIAGLPLAVERSMFWDHTYYAGHTGSSIGDPSSDWIFAEGSQGFFHTYVLLTNLNANPVDVRLTFLREGALPIVKNLTIAGGARVTVDCSTIAEIVDSSFGIVVHASEWIFAERAMYFGNTPTQLFSGGHGSAGAPAPAQSWFFAEGATGDFFDTFVLLSNPQRDDATVTLRFLLDTGETVTKTKTVSANGRLTINIEAEDDPRLKHAAVSTEVTSDRPIVAERSMYWIGDPAPWTESHNSFGVIDAGLHWGLAEGRLGGPLNFHTYILLANPQSNAAEVEVTFLRETDAPMVKTYTVPPTSRVTIDVNNVSADLQNESIGADIRVTNGVPIVVERSMYWDSGGVFFKGGTNATGVRLP